MEDPRIIRADGAAIFVCGHAFPIRSRRETCRRNPCGCCTLPGQHAGDCTNQRGHGLSARYVHACDDSPTIAYPERK